MMPLSRHLVLSTDLTNSCLDQPVWPVSRKSRYLFGPGKLFYVCHFAFKIKHLKFWINETELTGLWARNCATIQQFFILKFEICLRVRKVTGSSEKRVPGPKTFLQSTVLSERTQDIPSSHQLNFQYLKDQINQSNHFSFLQAIVFQFLSFSCSTKKGVNHAALDSVLTGNIAFK